MAGKKKGAATAPDQVKLNEIQATDSGRSTMHGVLKNRKP